MSFIKTIPVAIAAAGMTCAAPGQAAVAEAGLVSAGSAGTGSAEKLRRLDIMLMVTGLRCRTTSSDFQREHLAFEASHLAELNGASDELRRDLARTYGAAGSARALDRISTQMANRYGQGHPTMSCAALKQAAVALQSVHGRAELVAAADRLLAPEAGTRLAIAGQ